VLLFAFQSCEKKFNAVIDTAVRPPTLLSATITPSAINTDTINIGPERKPDDLLTIQLIASLYILQSITSDKNASVRYTVGDSASSTFYGEGSVETKEMQPSDSLYSGYIEFRIQRVVVGKLTATFWIENQEGYQSNSVVLPLEISRLNHPPVISNPVIPATINTLQQTFFVCVKAVDSDGQADIKTVVLINLLTHKSFPLNDDGIGGDVFAEDSVFSQTFSVDPNQLAGDYPFALCAVDRSSDSSNIITQTITITH
jgi:hypothetical protein